jgi:hypothetical protein
MDGGADRVGDGVAFGQGPAGEGDGFKDIPNLGAFVGDDTADSAGANNENICHE